MTWRDYFMNLAHAIKLKSKVPSTQVGAVAVDVDDRILESGYNGLPRHVCDHPYRYERPEKYNWVIHAEANLVATAARQVLKGSTVYVTHLPCNNCMGLLIQAGVSTVVIGKGLTHMPRELFDIATAMAEEAQIKLIFEK